MDEAREEVTPDELRAAFGKCFEDGVHFAARMARYMANQILEGKLPATGGAATLALLATMLDRTGAGRRG